MEGKRFASMDDFEQHAKQQLDRPAFEHLSGWDQHAEQSDFAHIKLKLRGMANLKYFGGIQTKILGLDVGSPICIGPLPALHDIKLVGGDNACSSILETCYNMRQVVSYNHKLAVNTQGPKFVHYRPTQTSLPQSDIEILKEKASFLHTLGLVIEAGYTPREAPQKELDRKNQFKIPARLSPEHMDE